MLIIGQFIILFCILFMYCEFLDSRYGLYTEFFRVLIRIVN